MIESADDWSLYSSICQRRENMLPLKVIKSDRASQQGALKWPWQVLKCWVWWEEDFPPVRVSGSYSSLLATCSDFLYRKIKKSQGKDVGRWVIVESCWRSKDNQSEKCLIDIWNTNWKRFSSSCVLSGLLPLCLRLSYGDDGKLVKAKDCVHRLCFIIFFYKINVSH